MRTRKSLKEPNFLHSYKEFGFKKINKIKAPSPATSMPLPATRGEEMLRKRGKGGGHSSCVS
jgi:hypothetical protein